MKPTAKDAHRSVPATDAAIADFYDCRCRKLPGTHTSGHCAQVEAVAR